MSSWWSFGATKKEQPSQTPTNYASPTQPFKTMSNTFRKGVQYNMKIVIRGDVMTGKSTLFDRLQGSDFEEENYKSTPQIQVANIPWHYKDSNDIVKIELWDVVDKAHNNNNKKDTGIKLEHTATASTEQATPTEQQTQEPTSSDMALDATTVDVYRNAHAALFIFDTTKQWTFDYVNNALASVPDNVAVLVLGNFTDKSRTVTVDEIHATLYEHNKRRIENGAIKPNLIRYVETSLKTGLGLKYIYEYFGVPFLELMMETLRKQLELKSTEILDLLENLDKNDEVPEFMQRRRGQDNFDQPSEPHLARQHEAMKMAWNEELEAIATEHEHTSVDNELQFDQSFKTPAPPTAPAKKKKKKGPLVTKETTPAIVDQFDAGSLEDDWFADESTPTQTITHAPLTTNANSKDEDDEDDNIPGNPMVARDEDVATVEYYQQQQQQQLLQRQQQQQRQDKASENPVESRQCRISQEPALMVVPDDDDTITTDNQEHDLDYGNKGYPSMYQPPVFKSELNDVWAAHNTAGGGVQSDSDDEDNIIRSTMDSPYLSPTSQQGFDSSPFTDVGMSGGGYEEIGGTHHDNPWYQPTYDELEIHSGEGSYYGQHEPSENESRNVDGNLSISGDHEADDSVTDKKAKKKKKKSKSVKTKSKTPS